MLWAASSCLYFFGFLRLGEIVCPSETSFDPQFHLAFADIAVDDQSAPSALQVRIKASKTDPFWQGVTLHIGTAMGALCPVEALLRYMVARGSNPGPLSTPLCNQSPNGALGYGLPGGRLCEPHLLHRRCDHSIPKWDSGLPHPNAGSMAEQRIHPLHPNLCTRRETSPLGGARRDKPFQLVAPKLMNRNRVINCN